ncbi:hypothetical protein J6E39_07545 [bacterium]|nr:hypothetical protein [bacterium]
MSKIPEKIYQKYSDYAFKVGNKMMKKAKYVPCKSHIPQYNYDPYKGMKTCLAIAEKIEKLGDFIFAPLKKVAEKIAEKTIKL